MQLDRFEAKEVISVFERTNDQLELFIPKAVGRCLLTTKIGFVTLEKLIQTHKK